MSLESVKSEKLKSLFDKSVDYFRENPELKKLGDDIGSGLALDSTIESPESVFYETFDLGKYEISDKPQLDWNNSSFMLVGSVDRVVFKKGGKSEDWYQNLTYSAVKFLELREFIEHNFASLNTSNWSKMESVIVKISQMTTFTNDSWEKMFKDSGLTDEEIYGSEGVYNFILAFQRAVSSIPRDQLAKEKFVSEPQKLPQLFKISLNIAQKEGDVRRDRYSRIIGVKEKGQEFSQDKEIEFYDGFLANYPLEFLQDALFWQNPRVTKEFVQENILKKTGDFRSYISKTSFFRKQENSIMNLDNAASKKYQLLYLLVLSRTINAEEKVQDVGLAYNLDPGSSVFYREELLNTNLPLLEAKKGIFSGLTSEKLKQWIVFFKAQIDALAEYAVGSGYSVEKFKQFLSNIEQGFNPH